MGAPGWLEPGDLLPVPALRAFAEGLTFGDLAEIYVLLTLNPKGVNKRLRAQATAALESVFGAPLTLDAIMSMYDVEPNFEKTFSEGDRFVLTALKYVGSVNTMHGPAQKVLVTIVTRESYASETERQVTYSALGAGFAALAQRATAKDFPHVAEYVRVALAGGNSVKRFARVDIEPGDWIKGDDGPPLTIEQRGDATTPEPTGAPSELGF